MTAHATKPNPLRSIAGIPITLALLLSATAALAQYPSFKNTNKSVTASPVPPGQRVIYTITTFNDLDPGNGVFTDTFDPCLDTGIFNPAADVIVTPGPGAVSYNAGTRTLTIDFGNFPAGVAAMQTIQINNLRAPGPSQTCCNQAVMVGAGAPAPYPSDDPSTTAVDDPTCFTTAGTPGPDFTSSTKDVAPRTGLTVGSPLTYTLVVENRGATGTTGPVRVTDTLVGCQDTSRFNPATDVVITPGPGTANYVAPNLTITLAPMPAPPAAAARQTITLTNIFAGRVDPACCNQATVSADGTNALTDDPTTPAVDDPTCMAIGMGSTGAMTFLKSASPSSGLNPGDPITFTFFVQNTFTQNFTALSISDEFDTCLDLSGFDAATGVVVVPGPAIVSYTFPALAIDLATLPMMPAAGSSQTITITGIRAGQDCCNQAKASVFELPSAVFSDDAGLPNPEDPTCVTVNTTGSGANLLRNSEWPGVTKANIFTGPAGGCGAANDPGTTLDPFGLDCILSAFPATDDDDLHAATVATGSADPQPAAILPAAGTLHFYQLDAAPSAGNGFRLVKRVAATDPSGFVIEINF